MALHESELEQGSMVDLELTSDKIESIESKKRVMDSEFEVGLWNCILGSFLLCFKICVSKKMGFLLVS